MQVLDQGLSILQEALKTLPSCPGVYEMTTTSGKVLYVGKAKDLEKRVRSYTRVAALPLRLKRMVAQIGHVHVTVTNSELEALLLEMNLIKKKQPPYNILLKDGKSMAYLVLSAHPYPQLLKKRSPNPSDGKLFGPFVSMDTLKTTMECLYKTFLLRSCSDHMFAQRRRPCLQYHIKKCSAPCVGKISPEAYQVNVRQAIDLLKGRSCELQKELLHEMTQASAAQQYEKAAQLRDRFRALSQAQAQQTIHCLPLENADVLALMHKKNVTCIQLFCFRKGANYGSQHFLFPQTDTGEEQTVMTSFLQQFYSKTPPPEHMILNQPLDQEQLLKEAFFKIHGVWVQFSYPKQGDKKRVLEHAELNADHALEQYFQTQNRQLTLRQKVQEVFDLPRVPERIEIYDNSHWQGECSHGGMVVMGPDGFLRRSFRIFSMQKTAGDDHDMMRHVMRKRFASGCEDKPDLMIIDGGKGHLHTVLNVMKELGQDLGSAGISIIAMAKGPYHRDGQETFYKDDQTITFTETDPVLHFLQRLRNEAHHFVIHHHRREKRQTLSKGMLDSIPGVGGQRRKALLCHFGDAQSVGRASLSQLQAVPGISKSLAEKIHTFFQENRTQAPV